MQVNDKFEMSIRINPNGLPPLVFDTPQSFFDSLTSERKFWTDLEQKARPKLSTDEAANVAMSAIRRRSDQAINRFQQIASAGGTEEQFKSIIRERGNTPFIPAGSPLAEYVASLSEADPLQAVRVAACCYDVPVELARTQWGAKWVRAAVDAELILRGLSLDPKNLDANLTNLANGWSDRFSAIEGSLNQLFATNRENSLKFSTLLEAESKRSEEAATQHLKEIATAITDGKAKIEAVRETYKTELTLQAPTTYWKDKQVAHRKITAGWIAAFIAIGALSALGIWRVWTATAAPHLIDKVPPSYGFFLPTVGAAFLSIWALRIISRQIISNLSLSSDAGERVAMVKTFLALMQKPEHVKEPDRVLILSALFRPTVNQNDDGAPPSWFDLVMQRIGPK